MSYILKPHINPELFSSAKISSSKVMGFSAAINVAEAGKKWPLAVHLLAEDLRGFWTGWTGW